MKTIVEALQDLYVALGGKESDVSGLKLNPDVIEQIAALVNGGALNELPAVTIEDAGDVLTVNASGEWEAAAPGAGGGGVEYCTFDLTDVKTGDNGNYVESDITAEAIYNAILSGKTVYAKFAGENTYSITEAVSVVYGIGYYNDEYTILDQNWYLCTPPSHITSFGVNADGKIEAYIYTD